MGQNFVSYDGTGENPNELSVAKKCHILFEWTLTDDRGGGDVGVEEELGVASLILISRKSSHPK